jgi:cytochrome c peroxidase
LDPDDGRLSGVQLLLDDEFNCLSQWSDAAPDDCVELRFVVAEGGQLVAAFKPPTLRNIAETAPYMHAGQFSTLEQVVAHYRRAPASPLGRTELEPLALNENELMQLVAFLRSLSGGVDASPTLLEAP